MSDVEPGGGLVEQDRVRFGGESARDQDTTPLPARQGVVAPSGQMSDSRIGHGPLDDDGVAHARRVSEAALRHDVSHRERSSELALLRNERNEARALLRAEPRQIVAGNAHLTFDAPLVDQTDQREQERALAGSRGPHDRDELAAGHGQLRDLDAEPIPSPHGDTAPLDGRRMRAMSTSNAYNHKKQRYRYYRCRASQEGLRCPTGLLHANDVEAAVVAQVKALAKSGALRDRILATLAEGDEGGAELVATKDRLEARITELGVEAKRLLGAFGSVDAGGRLLAERLGELERETDKHRAGVADLERRLRASAALRTEGEHVAKLLDAFDEVWDALVTEERREVLRALIARVGVDPESGTLRVTFHEPAPPPNPQPTREAAP